MPPADRLTSTPPELLLAILSHLPTASSLHPLSLTSKYLHAFLRTHAATICNTHILTRYPHAAAILHTAYSPTGWYLPTHPCVLAEEHRLLRDAILSANCRCTACQAVLYSSTSTSTSNLSVDRDADGSRPAACRAKHLLTSCIQLSRPGPQYLVFLEKYAWEIATRSAMGSPASSSASSEDEDGDGDGDGGAEEKARQVVFDFMIGNYCVRRFLETASQRLRDLASPGPEPQAHAHTSPSRLPLKERGLSEWSRKLRQKLWKAAVVRKEEVDVEAQPALGNLNAREMESPRRLMFGEISISPDEKALDRKQPLGERWEDGLLWYYGLQGMSMEGEGSAGERERAQKKRGCFHVLNRGIAGLGRRVRSWVAGARCVGGFRALDG